MNFREIPQTWVLVLFNLLCLLAGVSVMLMTPLWAKALGAILLCIAAAVTLRCCAVREAMLQEERRTLARTTRALHSAKQKSRSILETMAAIWAAGGAGHVLFSFNCENGQEPTYFTFRQSDGRVERVHFFDGEEIVATPHVTLEWLLAHMSQWSQVQVVHRRTREPIVINGQYVGDAPEVRALRWSHVAQNGHRKESRHG